MIFAEPFDGCLRFFSEVVRSFCRTLDDFLVALYIGFMVFLVCSFGSSDIFSLTRKLS